MNRHKVNGTKLDTKLKWHFHVSSIKAVRINYALIKNLFSKNIVFPQFWGKKWRHFEHAPASNTGLSLSRLGPRPIFSERGKRESRNKTIFI